MDPAERMLPVAVLERLARIVPERGRQQYPDLADLGSGELRRRQPPDPRRRARQ
jgi:hypothetical protein